MTQPRTRPARRRRVVVLLVLTVVLLLPPALGVWWAAQEALAHPGYDGTANHRTRLAFERTALIVAGLPLAGAVCGRIAARVRGRSAGVPTATGLLAGAAALWGIAIVSFLGPWNRMYIPW
ncbi:hypothetical protein ACIRSU_06950 [Streptomyces sp. NPDC101160]|uniref:hypothetical protein n=1 Tax=Streptomyces sp. NPDC101160 TaxID=3366118 RepID=UPI0037F40200